MDLEYLSNEKVAVLGFGAKEGKATAAYLLRHGITPVLFDRKPWDEWDSADQQHIQSLKAPFIFGPHYLDELAGIDVMFRNPAVPRLHPKLLEWERQGGIITSQTKWFFDHCPGTIIGVTGTKGKGTTSTLIAEMLKAGKNGPHLPQPQPKIYLTGNIGEIQPLDFMELVRPEDYIVYELSSFQLQDLHKSPWLAVVLMVTQEHLDHHADVEEYRDAKSSITRFQTEKDVCIYNADYSASAMIGFLGKGKKIPVSGRRKLSEGCWAEPGFVAANVLTGNFRFDTSFLQLKGDHNLENICAATAAALSLNIHPEDIQRTINGFKGLEHRLEYVGDFGGVGFYNDSFSTTPETALAALKSFSEPKIIILGGSTKHSDFSELGRAIAESPSTKALILIGQEAERIYEAVERGGGFKGQIFKHASGMDGIFAQIRQAAAPGDVVVLSPGCASFGMFKNYKDRGNQFKEHALKF